MSKVAKSIRSRLEHEITKRKGSRFITAAWPLNSDDAPRVQAQVRDMLDERRRLYPTACHHCFAYTTMDGRDYCSDDGEPHGTAGKPILMALQRAQLVDVCVVVSRIFGGTLLGTGGLIRAYGAAAQETLEYAEIVAKVPMTVIRVLAPFAHVDSVKHATSKFAGEIATQEYTDRANFLIRIPRTHEEAFQSFVRSRSSGAVTFGSSSELGDAMDQGH